MPEPKAPAPAEAPRILAIVREAFDARTKGEPITDRAELRGILDGPHAGHVLVLGVAK